MGDQSILDAAMASMVMSARRTWAKGVAARSGEK
jgi:hypothetical protein